MADDFAKLEEFFKSGAKVESLESGEEVFARAKESARKFAEALNSARIALLFASIEELVPVAKGTFKSTNRGYTPRDYRIGTSSRIRSNRFQSPNRLFNRDMAALNTNLFRPHHLPPTSPNFYLYHVYDNLSQSPFTQNDPERADGIYSADPNNYIMKPWHIVTYSKMMQHLDWSNREPTWIISLFDNFQSASNEYNRRRTQILVPKTATGGVSQRNPDSVHIAVVSVRRLQSKHCWYFSTSEMRQMLSVQPNHPLFFMSNLHEWFVLDWIPSAAVTQIL